MGVHDCLKFDLSEKQKIGERSGTDVITEGHLKVFKEENEIILFEIQ